MRRRLLLCLAATALTDPAAAQPQPAPRPPAAPADRPVNSQAVVAEVRRIIAERYVLPERRPALDAVLAEGLSAGRYNVADAAALAQRINADLARVGRDRHLNFNYDPRQAERLAAPSGPPVPGSASAFERRARAANHGISELRVLPGNVRYMAYDGFMWIGPETGAALDTAMQFLSGGDAVIIDLRRNGGGSPEAVQYVVSHFLPPDRPLVTFHMNGEASPERLASLRELRAPRMVGKPLYVLTSSGTASAAEEFAGHVGGYRIGELVGATTAGAGFRNDLVSIPGGFVLSVSVGRAVLASTGKDWEAVGLAPTVATPIESALDAAHAHALRRQLSSLQGPERADLEAVAEGIEARSRPNAPAAPLAAYAGTYGERSVFLEDGKLWYRLAARPKRSLVSLGGHRFTFGDDPSQRILFHPAGDRIAAFEIGPATGAAQGRYDRTGG